MNRYHREHFDAFTMVRRYLKSLTRQEKARLSACIEDYLSFRAETGRFLSAHFTHICTDKCFHNRLSACCSREGIIAFFGDTVVNTLISTEEEIDALLRILQNENQGFKCIYLGANGCMWRLKPIVCEMFLCDHAQEVVLAGSPALQRSWDRLKQKEKKYKWPDQPVLFDDLEKIFIDAGCTSPLMYLHNSPGLLRIKRQAHR